MNQSTKSLLFLPAHRLDRLPGAKRSGAHVVCVDLQDGLPEIDKNRGREALRELLRTEQDGLVAVRINSPGTSHGADDVKALRSCVHPPDAVILPMIQQAQDVIAAVIELEDVLRTASLVVMIETPSAICDIDLICAACPPNAALLFGNIDMSHAVGCANEWESLAYIRGRLILAAARWNLAAFDGVTIELENGRLLEEECIKSKKLGFVGKAAVHPKQIEVINRKFCATAEELAEARAIVVAYEAGTGGAVRVGNKMVDRPVYLAAASLLKNL